MSLNPSSTSVLPGSSAGLNSDPSSALAPRNNRVVRDGPTPTPIDPGAQQGKPVDPNAANVVDAYTRANQHHGHIVQDPGTAMADDMRIYGAGWRNPNEASLHPLTHLDIVSSSQPPLKPATIPSAVNILTQR